MRPVSSAVLRVVPVWAWAVAAALLYGGWQYRRAESAGAQLLAERAHVAALREQALHGALVETTRRLSAQQEVADAADRLARRARADAIAAGAAGERLRIHAARLAASAAACNTSSAGVSSAASAPAMVLADVLGRVEARGREVAAESDRRGVAGIACERSYDALRAEP